MLSDERLAKIQRLADAATPAPWSRVKQPGSKYWTLGVIRQHQAIPLELDKDWDFVESAREAVPELLAEIERLRYKLKQEMFRAECTENDLGGVREEQWYVMHNEELGRETEQLRAELARLRAENVGLRALLELEHDE